MSSGQRKRRPAGGPRKVPKELPVIECLEFYEKIGQGHFSEVYRGRYRGQIPVAIKLIERGSEHLIQTEIQILEDLRGQPNIVQLFEVIHEDWTILVFELVSTLSLDDFFDELDAPRLKWVIHNLCIATKAAHSKNIVHRDIKIGNVMISEDFKSLRLIDWGCGSYINDNMSSKAGSRSVRSPEMLLGLKDYGTGCDNWAVGIFIFYILTDGEIPWKCRTNSETLIAMSKVFGGNNIKALASKLHLRVEDDVRTLMKAEPNRTFEHYFADSCEDLLDPKLIDLMKKLLVLDPENRFTMEDALNHPYFK